MVDQGPTFDSSEGLSTTSISSRAQVCLKLFEIICDELHNVTAEGSVQNGYNRNFVLLTMQDGRAKFKAWGTNIAAFKDGRHPTSLDSRLKDAPEIRSRLLNVLQYLQEYLNDASQIIRGIKGNQIWKDGMISDSDSEEEEEEPASRTASNTGQETSELQELCTAIGSSNGSLMKLSMLIRDSSNRDDYLKAASRYNTWDPNPYIGHVREKYGSAKGNSNWLVERLGKSILRRRQFLRYREEHHGKLTGDWGEILNEEAEEIGPERLKPAKTVASTKATTFVVGNVSKKDGSDCGGSFGSQTSYEPTEFEGDGAATKLTVPPPPKWAFEDVPFRYGEPFRCPYCYLEQEVKNKAAWKKHVFRDLKPYVCTFVGCGMRMFRSRNEWFAHELQCHRREWVCQYCQHRAFTSASTYSNHLESSHPAILRNSQLEALLLQSEEPVDKIASNACPLCDEWEANLNHSKQDSKRLLLNNGRVVEPYGTPKQFRRHLGRHMEQLALFALPIREGDGLEDDSSEDGDSEQGSEKPQSKRSSKDKGGTQIGLESDAASGHTRVNKFTIASPDEEMHGKAVALFDFQPENDNELRLVEGQIVWVSYRHGQGWLVAMDPKTHDSGLVPEEYVRLLRDIQNAPTLSKINESTQHLEPQNEQVSDSKIKAQLSEEYGIYLDSATMQAIFSEYDLTRPGELGAARKALDGLSLETLKSSVSEDLAERREVPGPWQRTPSWREIIKDLPRGESSHELPGKQKDEATGQQQTTNVEDVSIGTNIMDDTLKSSVLDESSDEHSDIDVDFKSFAEPREDWTKISDLDERLWMQNRIAQRSYREKLKRRLKDLEKRAGSTSASLTQTPTEVQRSEPDGISKSISNKPNMEEKLMRTDLDLEQYTKRLESDKDVGQGRSSNIGKAMFGSTMMENESLQTPSAEYEVAQGAPGTKEPNIKGPRGIMRERAARAARATGEREEQETIKDPRDIMRRREAREAKRLEQEANDITGKEEAIARTSPSPNIDAGFDKVVHEERVSPIPLGKGKAKVPHYPSDDDKHENNIEIDRRGRSPPAPTVYPPLGTSSYYDLDSDGEIRMRRGRASSASLPIRDITEGRQDVTGSDSSGSPSGDEEHIKKIKGKQLLTAGLDTVATIHAAHNVYRSMEKRDARDQTAQEGEIAPEEARKLEAKVMLQDAASDGRQVYESERLPRTAQGSKAENMHNDFEALSLEFEREREEGDLKKEMELARLREEKRKAESKAKLEAKETGVVMEEYEKSRKGFEEITQKEKDDTREEYKHSEIEMIAEEKLERERVREGGRAVENTRKFDLDEARAAFIQGTASPFDTEVIQRQRHDPSALPGAPDSADHRIQEPRVANEQLEPGKKATKPRITNTKKPRVSAGCLTCRERRVKCDEAKPYCQRCIKFGRPCGGYVSKPTAESGTGTDNSPLDVLESSSSYSSPLLIPAAREHTMTTAEFPSRPTFTRMSRKHLSLETLYKRKVPFELDQQDPDYVLITRWVPEGEQDALWAHTRALRGAREGKKLVDGTQRPEIKDKGRK